MADSTWVADPPVAGRMALFAGMPTTVWVLALATFAEGVLLSVVPTTLAGIGALFGQTAGSLTWVVTVQLLATGVCTLSFSRLGDVWGHRRVLRLALVVTAAGSVLAAVAPSFAVLLVGRAMQGPIGAATPLAVGVLRERLGADRLRRGIGVVVAGLTAGSAAGLLGAAELFRATGDVRAVLSIPAGCLVIAAVGAFRLLPVTLPRAAVRVDWLGALTLGGGLGVLLLALAKGGEWGWTSSRALACLSAAVAALVAWGVIESQAAEPLVDLRLLSRRAVAPFYAASLTLGVAFFGATSAATTFLASSSSTVGYGFGLNLTDIAYVTLPSSVAIVLGALLAAPVAGRSGHKAAVCVGCGALVVGYSALALWHGALGEFIVTGSLAAFGVGVVSGAMPTVLTERNPTTSTSVSTGLFITGRAVGGSIAGAGFASLLSRITIGATSTPRESAYVAVWLVCAAAALVSLVVVGAAADYPKLPDAEAGLGRSQGG